VPTAHSAPIGIDIKVSVLYTLTGGIYAVVRRNPLLTRKAEALLSDIKVQFFPHSKWTVSYYENKSVKDVYGNNACLL
jgi:hypothetical protein